MNKWFALAMLAGLGLWGNSRGIAATIEWGAAFEIESDADVDVSNDIVRAVNVAATTVPPIEVTFPDGTTVEFESEHTFEFNPDLNGVGLGGGSVTGTDVFFTGQDDGLTTDNPELDMILNSHGWVSGGPDGAAIAVLELSELVVGQSYQIQLIGPADDRGCCEYRQMQIWTDDLEPVNEDLWFGRSNDFDQDDDRGPGSVIGVFTADATEQYINLVGAAGLDDGNGNDIGDGNDPGLSAYVLSLAGGGPGVPGDFNGNGALDLPDIDDLTGQSAGGTNPAAYDLNADTLVNTDDVNVWVKDLYNSWIGDADLDGEFNSGDLVIVLASGAYEADVNSVWSTGDFNGDGRTNSGDLVAALADGGYEAGPRAAVASVPEPTAFALFSLSLFGVAAVRRRLR